MGGSEGRDGLWQGYPPSALPGISPSRGEIDPRPAATPKNGVDRGHPPLAGRRSSLQSIRRIDCSAARIAPYAHKGGTIAYGFRAAHEAGLPLLPRGEKVARRAG